jgi:hypothetical protein
MTQLPSDRVPAEARKETFTDSKWELVKPIPGAAASSTRRAAPGEPAEASSLPAVSNHTVLVQAEEPVPRWGQLGSLSFCLRVLRRLLTQRLETVSEAWSRP